MTAQLKRLWMAGLCIVVCFAVSSCSKKADSPEKAYEITKNAALKSDWNAYWNMLSQDSRDKFDKQVKFMQSSFTNLPESMRGRMLESMGMTAEEMNSLDGRSFFISMQEKGEEDQSGDSQYNRDLFDSSKIVKKEVDGDHAILYIEDEDGNTAKLPLVREDGVWKLDLAQMYSF